VIKDKSYRDRTGKIFAYSSPKCTFGEVLGVRMDEQIGQIGSNIGDFKIIIGEVKLAITEVANRVEEAVKMAREAATHTFECKRAVEQSRFLIEQSNKNAQAQFNKFMFVFLVFILTTVSTTVFTGLEYFEKKKHIKIDVENQKQTVSYLDNLNQGIKIDGINGIVHAIKSLDDASKAKLVKAITQKR
jgi:hypothetical protein